MPSVHHRPFPHPNRPRRGRREPLRTLLVFAHPDDETVGMGAHLARLGAAWFLCVTDGAPPHPGDAHHAGCAGRSDYARLREAELRAAVQCAGHPPERVAFLGVGDQRASFRLVEITRAIDTWIGAVRPHLVITHPYEGGHPDHDATAFAVHAAVALRAARGALAPVVVEMTSYHSRGGEMTFGEFLPGSGGAALTLSLTPASRQRKQRLIACHASQARVLAAVPLRHERFRRAPACDFTRPPHAGTLFYEQFPWGMSGPHWRTLARAALAELGTDAVAAPARGALPCDSRS